MRAQDEATEGGKGRGGRGGQQTSLDVTSTVAGGLRPGDLSRQGLRAQLQLSNISPHLEGRGCSTWAGGLPPPSILPARPSWFPGPWLSPPGKLQPPTLDLGKTRMGIPASAIALPHWCSPHCGYAAPAPHALPALPSQEPPPPPPPLFQTLLAHHPLPLSAPGTTVPAPPGSLP